MLRVFDVLDAWAAGVLAPVGEADAKTRLDRMMAVADVLRTLVELVRPEVRAASGG